MAGIRNADWTRDEIILACDLVRANGWRELRADRREVIDLSAFLQRYWAHRVKEFNETFRNANGVGRKTTDIATQHPQYLGKPTRGNKLDRIVLQQFLDEPDEMHRQALAIRGAMETAATVDDPDDDLPDLDLDGAVGEGGLLERLQLRRERDRRIRERALRAYKRQHGRVACDVCGFDFAAVYGQHGEDYIECHHRIPLSESGVTTTRIADLVLLRSNCHRMIHRKRPWLKVDQLISMINGRVDGS